MLHSQLPNLGSKCSAKNGETGLEAVELRVAEVAVAVRVEQAEDLPQRAAERLRDSETKHGLPIVSKTNPTHLRLRTWGRGRRSK